MNEEISNRWPSLVSEPPISDFSIERAQRIGESKAQSNLGLMNSLIVDNHESARAFLEPLVPLQKAKHAVTLRIA